MTPFTVRHDGVCYNVENSNGEFVLTVFADGQPPEATKALNIVHIPDPVFSAIIRQMLGVPRVREETLDVVLGARP